MTGTHYNTWYILAQWKPLGRNPVNYLLHLLSTSQQHSPWGKKNLYSLSELSDRILRKPANRTPDPALSTSSSSLGKRTKIWTICSILRWMIQNLLHAENLVELGNFLCQPPTNQNRKNIVLGEHCIGRVVSQWICFPWIRSQVQSKASSDRVGKYFSLKSWKAAASHCKHIEPGGLMSSFSLKQLPVSWCHKSQFAGTYRSCTKASARVYWIWTVSVWVHVQIAIMVGKKNEAALLSKVLQPSHALVLLNSSSLVLDIDTSWSGLCFVLPKVALRTSRISVSNTPTVLLSEWDSKHTFVNNAKIHCTVFLYTCKMGNLAV